MLMKKRQRQETCEVFFDSHRWSTTTTIRRVEACGVCTSLVHSPTVSFRRCRQRLKACWLVAIWVLLRAHTIVMIMASEGDHHDGPFESKSSNDNNSQPEQQQQSNDVKDLNEQEQKDEASFLKWMRELQDGEETNNGIIDLNSTLLPTLEVTNLPEETSSPTSVPTISHAPTPLTSASPTDFDSEIPSAFPTDTYRPSYFPSSTFSPSHTPSMSLKPSVSMEPSVLPSNLPTMKPTDLSSSVPSGEPTITGQPTITPRPTESFSPTTSAQPSLFPTPVLSSISPSISLSPSNQPSQEPSPEPTISIPPSNMPSISNRPTISSNPTNLPSDTPSWRPSNLPSLPSEFPSVAPTIVLEDEPFVADKVYMVLDGFTAELTEEEIDIWQNVTSQHIVNYWARLQDEHPKDSPLFVSSVITELTSQTILGDEVSIMADEEAMVIKIMYQQEFVYGIVGQDQNDPPLEPDILQYYLVLLPFKSNSYEYSNTLVENLNLTNFVLLTQIEAGDPPALPPVQVHGPTISQAAVRAISASIVVGACLIVAFLLWDRKRKDTDRFPADSESDYDDSRHARRRGMDTLEFDNAGQPVDWTNPYSEAATAASVLRAGTVSSEALPGGTRSGAVSVSSKEGSQNGELPAGPLARATIIRNMPGGTVGSSHSANLTTLDTVESTRPPPPPPMPIGGKSSNRRSEATSQRTTSSGSLPPLAPSGASNGVFHGGSGRYSNGSSPSPYTYTNSPGFGPAGNFRHVISMTDTDITDLTYSDFQSEGRGSDVANLAHLPPISDESLNYTHPKDEAGTMVLSPLHIPDEEAIGLAADLSPPSSPNPRVTDLSSDVTSPTVFRLTGFDMQIEELE